ncbi:hypothetical protein D3C85_1594710 [compost metagenome]
MAQLLLDDVYLRVQIDGEQYTLKRFQESSDTYALFVALFNKPTGHVLRITDVFPRRSNIRKIITDAKLSYLLPMFFNENLSVRELQLLSVPVKLSEQHIQHLLSKSK